MPNASLQHNVLRFRRLRALSQQEIAEKAGLSRQAYIKIERGENSPRSKTILNLAKALNIKLHDLVREKIVFSSVRFRIGNTVSKRVEIEREQELQKIGEWLRNYNELESYLNEKHAYIFQGQSFQNPIAAAAASRSLLKLNSKEPVFDVCGLLEHAGVKIYLSQANIEKYFGMSLGQQDGGPAVAVNVRDGISIERQIFTVAHEFGHLLLHTSSYQSNEIAEDDREEIEANIFASHFLMPNDGFIKEWDDSRGTPSVVDRVLHIKRIFKVSYLTVLRRLIDLKKSDQDIYKFFAMAYHRKYGKNLKNHAEPENLKEPDGLLKSDFMEIRYHRLVREALEKEEISFNKAAEMLGLTVIQMRDIVRTWSSEPA